MTDALPSPIPIPMNEFARNIALGAVAPEDGSHNKIFHEITELVREAFGTPVALVTLIDGDQSHHLAHAGTDIGSIPKTMSVCANALASRKPLVIPDMLADPRWEKHVFANNPPHVRFYAGAPIILSSGFAIGTICAIGLEPRTAEDVGPVPLLVRLAQIVTHIYELPFESQKERIEQYERASEAAQEEFLALVSHELRTPLSGIVGLSDCFEPGRPAEPELVEALTQSARHLTAIVDNVLTFSELRSGDISLDETRFDPGAVAAQAVAAFSPLSRMRGKTLNYVPDGTGLILTADAVKLELALSCLLSNVVLHGGAEASVTMVQNRLGHLVIDVTDNGAGIDADRIHAVQAPFVTGQNVRTRTANGLGLGLPLVRRLVELQGGMLQLSDTKGSFAARIILPSWRVESAG